MMIYMMVFIHVLRLKHDDLHDGFHSCFKVANMMIYMMVFIHVLRLQT